MHKMKDFFNCHTVLSELCVDYTQANKNLFVMPEIPNYKLSQWDFTNCTDMAASSLRLSNWVRKSLKTTLNRDK